MLTIAKCNLKKLLILIALLFFILTGNNLFGEDKKVNYDNVEKLINKKNIDIGKLSLTISKLAFTKLDIKKSLNEIDKMAGEIRKDINKKDDPYYKIGLINDYLYKTNEFSYDMDDKYAKKTSNQFIGKYIETKKGSCITMPLLYFIIGTKLGLPIRWVRAPEHFFCRYMLKDGTYINIETTSGGKVAPDESYIKDFQITENEIKKGIYMKSLSSKECAADMLCVIGLYYSRLRGMVNAIKYLNDSSRLYPGNPLAYRALSLVYKDMGKKEEAKDLMEKAISYGYEERKSLELPPEATKEVKKETVKDTKDVKKKL